MEILEAASSWLQGIKPMRTMSLFKKKHFTLVTKTMLSGHRVSQEPKEPNLANVSQEAFLMDGNLVSSVTDRRSPSHLFDFFLPSGLKSSRYKKRCLLVHILMSIDLSNYILESIVIVDNDYSGDHSCTQTDWDLNPGLPRECVATLFPAPQTARLPRPGDSPGFGLCCY